ncbi:hypothetical protein MMC11_001430 [Xylographa trunciseda]|nr:hypothetical protein [Xylographa trunciseda]
MAKRSQDGEIRGLSTERSKSPRAPSRDRIFPLGLLRASRQAAERVPPVTKASLLGLPPEIRLLIYGYIFFDDVYQFPTIINLRYGEELAEWVKDMDLTFCEVFRGIYHEALPVAFASASFRLDGFVRSGEWSYRAEKQNSWKDPDDSRMLRSLIDQIRIVHVDLMWLIKTGDRVHWHRAVSTPKLLRTVVVHLPYGGQAGVDVHLILKSSGLCAEIGVAVQKLIQEGLKIHFECGSLTDLELLAWGEAFSQPGNSIPAPPSDFLLTDIARTRSCADPRPLLCLYV